MSVLDIKKTARLAYFMPIIKQARFKFWYQAGKIHDLELEGILEMASI